MRAFCEQAKAAVHARPDFHAQLRPAPRAAVMSEPSCTSSLNQHSSESGGRPVEDLARVVEEKQVAVENHEPVAGGEMRDVEELQRERVCARGSPRKKDTA